MTGIAETMTPKEMNKVFAKEIANNCKYLKYCAYSYTFGFDKKDPGLTASLKEIKKVLSELATRLYIELVEHDEKYKDVSINFLNFKLHGFLEQRHIDDPIIDYRDDRKNSKAVTGGLWLSYFDKDKNYGFRVKIEMYRRYDDDDGVYKWTIHREDYFPDPYAPWIMVSNGCYESSNGIGGEIFSFSNSFTKNVIAIMER
jgi:hypothetical protein